MNNPIIVADASPLIAFARIEHLPLLVKALGSIFLNLLLKKCTFDKSRPGAADSEILPLIKNLKALGYYFSDSLMNEIAKIAHE